MVKNYKLSQIVKDILEYKYLILLFIKSDLKLIYKQTILGPVWLIIQPILASVVFSFFGSMLGVKTHGVPAILFYMTGTSLWLLVSQTLLRVSSTFINNIHIFSKIYFPRLCMPIAYTFSTFLRFLIQFFVLLSFIFYFIFTKELSIHPSFHVLLIPIVILHTQILAFSIGLIFASITVKYRDLTLLLDLFVQLWMYLTPILYLIPNDINKVFNLFFYLNPMTALVNIYRYVLIGVGEINYSQWIVSIFITLILLLIGIKLFKNIERTFVDIV